MPEMLLKSLDVLIECGISYSHPMADHLLAKYGVTREQFDAWLSEQPVCSSRDR